jgi:hypothetical protein
MAEDDARTRAANFRDAASFDADAKRTADATRGDELELEAAAAAAGTERDGPTFLFDGVVGAAACCFFAGVVGRAELADGAM